MRLENPVREECQTEQNNEITARTLEVENLLVVQGKITSD
jgi:hypothetical protein